MQFPVYSLRNFEIFTSRKKKKVSAFHKISRTNLYTKAGVLSLFFYPEKQPNNALNIVVNPQRHICFTGNTVSPGKGMCLARIGNVTYPGCICSPEMHIVYTG